MPVAAPHGIDIRHDAAADLMAAHPQPSLAREASRADGAAARLAGVGALVAAT